MSEPNNDVLFRPHGDFYCFGCSHFLGIKFIDGKAYVGNIETPSGPVGHSTDCPNYGKYFEMPVPILLQEKKP